MGTGGRGALAAAALAAWAAAGCSFFEVRRDARPPQCRRDAVRGDGYGVLVGAGLMGLTYVNDAYAFESDRNEPFILATAATALFLASMIHGDYYADACEERDEEAAASGQRSDPATAWTSQTRPASGSE